MCAFSWSKRGRLQSPIVFKMTNVSLKFIHPVNADRIKMKIFDLRFTLKKINNCHSIWNAILDQTFYFKIPERAAELGQDLRKREFKDLSWLGLKTRSRDATLSRHKGININELYLHTKIAQTPTGETWQGKWQGNEIAAKILAVRECTPRISRDFNDEYPKLRIFSHPNVMPVIGCCNSPPNLVVISQFAPIGSLYQVLHEGSNLVVDAPAAIQFAIDIAKGMAFLHSLERQLPRFFLNSRHVMVSYSF